MEHAARAAKQEITEAGKFLLGLHTEHDTRIVDLKQERIDIYWSEGPAARKHIRNFLQQRGLTGRRRALSANAREAETTPTITGRERLDRLRQVIEADQVTRSTRIAAIILLLYGTPIGTIAGLRVDDFTTTLTVMTINLGTQPARIPDPLIPLITDYLALRTAHNAPGGDNSAIQSCCVPHPTGSLPKLAQVRTGQ